MDPRAATVARPPEAPHEGIKLPGISAILSPAPDPSESRPSHYGYGGVSPHLSKPTLSHHKDGPLFTNPHNGYRGAPYPPYQMGYTSNVSPTGYHSASPSVYHSAAHTPTHAGYMHHIPGGPHSAPGQIPTTLPPTHPLYANTSYPTPKQEYDARPPLNMGQGYDHVHRPLSPRSLHEQRSLVPRPVTPPGQGNGAAGPNQYVGQQFVNGKGLCHVFADGGTMKTHINGEPVNPQWGITKAGKPRKRLAQACITCREKKIKCEPGLYKCQQCQKLNKECKRADDTRLSPENSTPTAVGLPPSGEASPGDDIPASVSSNSKKRPPTPPSMSSGETEKSSPASPIRSEETSQPPAKKPRLQALDTTTTELGQPLGFFVSKGEDLLSVDAAIAAHNSNDVSSWRWDQDPWLVDAKKTDMFLELYFNNRGTGCYTLVPQNSFLEWVKDERDKTREELMLLYTMMAVGSIFTTDPEDRQLGEHLASIARLAEQELWANFSPQLVQTRLYLMFFAFAKGRLCDAWELAGSGFRTLAALKYNTEDGINRLPPPNDKDKYEFGLNQVQAIDFRRRVFWIGYTMDRYTGYCSDQIGTLKDEDIFLRLPLHKENYCGGIDATTPFFNAGRPFKIRQELGGMAAVVLINSIWGDIVSTAYRCMNKNEDRPEDGYAAKMTSFHAEMSERIKEWETNLPRPLRYNSENTQANLKNGQYSNYFVVHAIRGIAGMTLNRLGRAELLPAEVVRQRITETIIHARRLLSIVSALSKQDKGSRNADLENALGQPFPAFAVLNACDVVMCGGEIDEGNDTTKLVADALDLVNDIGRYWSEARTQSKWIESRRLDMTTYGEERDHRFWRLQKQMKGALLRREHDLLYNAPSDVFFEAIKQAYSIISI